MFTLVCVHGSCGSLSLRAWQSLSVLTGLTSLSLFYCAVTDVGLRHVACLTNLTSLNLDSRDITDAAMKHIAGPSLVNSSYHPTAASTQLL